MSGVASVPRDTSTYLIPDVLCGFIAALLVKAQFSGRRIRSASTYLLYKIEKCLSAGLHVNLEVEIN